VQARINHPAMSVPGAYDALQALSRSARHPDLPESIVNLVELRASQINGCSFCVDMHSRDAKKAGETDARLWAVAAWRESPEFSEAERAALALTEAMTRISDRPDPVPDEIFDRAAEHYAEPVLAALMIHIAAINVWNRLNVAIRQPAGAWQG
jgi:AhpD family alkylhydroperoxidase